MRSSARRSALSPMRVFVAAAGAALLLAGASLLRAQEDIYRPQQSGGTRPSMSGKPVEVYVPAALPWKGPLPEVRLELLGACALKGEPLSDPAWAGDDRLAVLTQDPEAGDYQLQLCPASGGPPAWSIALPEEPSAPPAADAERIYVATTAGAVAAYDPSNGHPIWRAELTGPPPIGIALLGASLSVGTSSGLAALDPASGALRFSLDLGAAPAMPPASCSERWFVPLASGSVRALDAASGRVLWQKRLDGLPAPASCSDGRVAVGTGSRRLLQLHAKSGGIVWKQKMGGGIAVPPVLRDGGVYAASLDGRLYGFKSSTGHRLWAQPVGERVKRTPALIGGVLALASTGETRLSFLHLPTGKLLLEAEAPADTAGWVGSPAARGERLALAADRRNSPDGVVLVYRVVVSLPRPGPGG